MSNDFRCDACGKFIPYKDIENGDAEHLIASHDTDYSSESWETTCKKCNEKDKSQC